MTLLNPQPDLTPDTADIDAGRVQDSDARLRQRADLINRNKALLSQLNAQGTPVDRASIVELKLNVLLSGMMPDDQRLDFETEFDQALNQQLEHLVEETAKQARTNSLAINNLIGAAGIPQRRRP